MEVDWAFETPGALPAPGGQQTVAVETDHDGRYRVEPIEVPAGVRLVRTTVIVYQHGYVAYRSDRRFDDSGARADFAAQWMTVKLDRFTPALSHARHVVFIGGGDRMHDALEEERIRAAFELVREPAKTSTSAAKPLDASVLLSEDEYRAMTGFEGTLTVERLTDLPQSAVYDSRHFRAVDKPESFDAAIRVWRLGAAAPTKLAALGKEIPGSTPLPNVGDGAVSGQDGNIYAVAAIDRDAGVVIELTCGADQCKGAAQAAALMRRLLSRVDRLTGHGAQLAPAPVETPAKKPEPTPEIMPLDDDEKPETKTEPERPFQLKPPTLHR